MKIDYRFSVAPMMGYTTPHARYFYRLLSKKSILFTEAPELILLLSSCTEEQAKYI